MRKNITLMFTNRFDIVNFLRVIATVFVFVLHGKGSVVDISESAFFNIITTLPAWAGVWIFLFLSGYTVGLGFFKGRYIIVNDNNHFCFKKYLLFCWGRFLKIAPFYYIYCFLWEILCGNFYFLNNPQILLKVLTFSFNGNGGAVGMGHLWYVSTAMQMYLIMPIVYLLIRKLETPVHAMVVFFAVLFTGLFLRFYLLLNGADWYSEVYTSFIGNIDLVVCGMIIAFFKTQHAPSSHPSRRLRCLASIVFAALVGYNVVIYVSASTKCLIIYQYCLPSFYILASSVLIAYLGNIEYRPEPVSLKAFLRNPLTVIDWFAPKTYAFYIFHIVALNYAAYAMSVIAFFEDSPTSLRIIVQYVLAFLIAFICSSIFSKISFRCKRKEMHPL